MESASLKALVLFALFLVALASAAVTNKATTSKASCKNFETGLEPKCYIINPKSDKIEKSDKRYKKGLINCPCSPTKRGASENATKIFDDIRKQIAEAKKKSQTNLFDIIGDAINGLKFEEIFKVAMTNCIAVNSVEDCVNADANLRGKIAESVCTFDSKTKANLYNNATLTSPSYIAVLPCDTDNTYAMSKKSVNEGCVAIEHLKGYELQHASHLLRPVLCSNGFCATPNHAIIVKGEMTSMKQLCGRGQWKCEQQVRLVNNLKISANRRAKFNDDIIITPYDVRFPKAVIWAVQIAEDVWNVLTLSVCTATLAGIAVLLVSKADTKN